ISKIIGAPPGYIGYDDTSNILEQIKNKPYSVLILDEIEKAHKNIINLFLQVLDEGKIKDSKSNTVRFDNVVVILTSNIGFHDINVGFRNNNKVKTKLNDKFSIPFMNRVDNIIEFKPLCEEEIIKIINNKIKDLKEKYKNKISVRISKQVICDIIKESNFEEYGARKIGKIIKDTLETQIIDSLLNSKETVYIKGKLKTV
ncbi:MAG: AAA family ATPase, partial [Alphaproteobacteria bacterium]|nr:AAA family ATPase [Alphaproteobacteria bacterium]